MAKVNEYTCPDCRSNYTRSVQLEYNKRVSKYSGNSVGVGTSTRRGGLFLWGSSSRGRRKSLFAEQLEPPIMLSAWLLAHSVYIVFGGVFLTVFSDDMWPNLGYLIAGVFAVAVTIDVVNYLLEDGHWVDMWICLRCGTKFWPDTRTEAVESERLPPDQDEIDMSSESAPQSSPPLASSGAAGGNHLVEPAQENHKADNSAMVHTTTADIEPGFRNGTGKTTRIGYQNRNRQLCLGTRGTAGSDHNAVSYKMKCLDCGGKYGANGTDVFHRKCPSCQGGAPGIDY